MIAAGVWPDIISSDVHGRFDAMHDDSMVDYSLAGAFARLVALGMPFADAIAAVTVNPARVLREEAEIGTLAVGSRADITVLEERIEPWPYDSQSEALVVERRWIPAPRDAAGELIVPSLRLVRDATAAPRASPGKPVSPLARRLHIAYRLYRWRGPSNSMMPFWVNLRNSTRGQDALLAAAKLLGRLRPAIGTAACGYAKGLQTRQHEETSLRSLGWRVAGSICI